MLTDSSPRKAYRAGFLESDRIRTLDLPQDECLRTCGKSVESAMKDETSVAVRLACTEFLAATSEFYRTPICGVRVLAARPLRVRENWASELFGDYNPETMLIRVWMRTAVRKEITSFGTFLSTLCMNSATISISSVSDFRIHGTLAVSTSALLRCTTMHGGRRQATILVANNGRALADRLAAHESRCMTSV